MFQRLEFHPSEFEGKAQKGLGLGGARDHISNPLNQSQPNVIHVNDVHRRAFDDDRGRALQEATKSFPKPEQMNDRRFWEYHKMDYTHDPSVGNRQVDHPEYANPQLYERFRMGTPSERMKADTILPGPADSESGYRRNVFYDGPKRVPRPLQRKVHNDSMRIINARATATSTMAEMGKSDNPLARDNNRKGARRKVELNTIGQLLGNDVAPRPQTRTHAPGDNHDIASDERRDKEQQLRNTQLVRDDMLDTSTIDLYNKGGTPEMIQGEQLGGMPGKETVMGEDYYVYPSGRTTRAEVGSGTSQAHHSTPTTEVVRKPQHATTRYQVSNLMDTQKVWGMGSDTWGFENPVRAKGGSGMHELFRTPNPRRIQGNTQHPNAVAAGISNIHLVGTSTNGGDFAGGKKNSSHVGLRYPTQNVSYATQSETIGMQVRHHKRMNMDSTVAPHGGEAYELEGLLTNNIAPRHQGYYNMRASLNSKGSEGVYESFQPLEEQSAGRVDAVAVDSYATAHSTQKDAGGIDSFAAGQGTSL